MLGLNGFANDPNWVLDFGRDYPRLAWEGTSGQVVPEPDIDRLGGAGTSEDPYRIDTAEQLIFLGRASVLCYKHLALRADLDLARDLPSENVSASAVIPAFAGVFDGEGHTISHLTIKGPKNLGLFGHVTSKAEVRDVKIADVNIAGSGIYVGGLIGRNDGTVIRCDSTGSVSGGSIVGGLVGENKGTMTHCRATGSVSGSYNVGGLVGSNWGNIAASHSSASVDGDGSVGGIAGENVGSMTHCYSTGPVSVGEPYEGGGGGLVGENYATVVSCYSTSAVSGNRVVGGLVGENYATVSFSYSVGPVSGEDYIGGLAGSNEGHLTQCYSIGRVSGNSNVGGLVGGWRADTVSPPVVIACFWDVQTSGQTWSDGSTGKATAEMQTASTFLDAGWDFVGEVANGTDDIWWINEGKDYPRLWWEGPAGMVFVDIPAGTFEMGDHDIAGYRNDQKPVHAVTLDGFQMSQCEITNAQYAQFLNAAMAAGLIQVVNGVVYASSDANLAWAYCDTYASSPYSQIVYSQGRFSVRSRDGLAMSDHPVARVSWYGAAAFCDHYGYHLPTEAQWEYAARGGYHDPYYRYPWGSDDIDCSLANCKTDSGFCNPLGLTSWPFTVPVGYYGPQGAYGLCDMSGNLWEWCQDWYDAGYYAVSPKSNPAGPETGTTRVLRGGAWDVHGDSCHVADRSVADPLVRGQVVGFRVCR
jgi:formylglycine-generating enzyme required for sulfatase activity